LLFPLVVLMVCAGVAIHPVSLRLVAGLLRYEDKVAPSDLIFVPRFPEDKNGELYAEAFREFWLGNGKAIVIEDDKIFGFSIKELVWKMARERGIKENAITAIETEGEGLMKATRVKGVLAKGGARRVIVVAPSYGSRLLHSLYGSGGSSETNAAMFLIRPTEVSYFKKDSWWKNGVSRGLAFREIYQIATSLVTRAKPVKTENSGKE
jgi:hypothetical protein